MAKKNTTKEIVKLGTDKVVTFDYPKTVAATPKFPFERKLVLVSLDVLANMPSLKDNPREQSSIDANASSLSIRFAEEGLRRAIPLITKGLGFSMEEPGYVKGGCSIPGLVRYREANPERFAEQFGEDSMIPCYAFECDDATARHNLIHDHSQDMGLATKLENFETHWSALRLGKSRKQVIVDNLGNLIARAKGGKSLKKANDLEAEAYAVTNVHQRRQKLKEAQVARCSAFQGQMQDRDREVNTPLVIDAIRFSLSGDRPTEGILSNPDLLPDNASLTKKEIVVLNKAHKADLASDQEGVDLAHPGTIFMEAWNAQIKVWEDADDGVVAARSLSSKKLVAEARKGRSKGVAAVLMYASQASVTGVDKEGDAITQKVEDGDLAAYIGNMASLDADAKVIEFAKQDAELRAIWKDLVSQVTGRREKATEAAFAAKAAE